MSTETSRRSSLYRKATLAPGDVNCKWSSQEILFASSQIFDVSYCTYSFPKHTFQAKTVAWIQTFGNQVFEIRSCSPWCRCHCRSHSHRGCWQWAALQILQSSTSVHCGCINFLVWIYDTWCLQIWECVLIHLTPLSESLAQKNKLTVRDCLFK